MNSTVTYRIYSICETFTPYHPSRAHNMETRSIQRQDVESTLFQRCVPAGIMVLKFEQIHFIACSFF